ncbi:MAG TPA: ATP-binding protein [Bacillota bacterium]|nr:ATP-binding protein [Bacillota bacterium]
MPVNETEWFDSKRILTSDGLKPWQQAIFDRAFCTNDGPFMRVCNRLRSGFSVLVYLPGNCMAAAADYVKDKLKNVGEWSCYGEHPGSGDIREVWTNAAGIVGNLLAWFNREKSVCQNAIFHNLDLLSDGHGGVYGAIEAQTALFSIIEGTRKGVVLGLADRAAGQLPERVTSAFGEAIWLDEIPAENFRYLLPRELAQKIHARDRQGRCVPDNKIWMLAARLRWTDPMRAVKIMSDAAQDDNWPDILNTIWKATRSIDFEDPNQAPEKISGIPESIRKVLERQVIEPYCRWRNLPLKTGDGANLSADIIQSQLQKLPPGIIFFGPPGTGKTHLARWLAGSLQLPVRIISGSDIKVALWGDAEKNIRRVFEDARRAAPCVLVFDDADDLFTDRVHSVGSAGGSERGVVDVALQQLDGFIGRPSGVLVILTTNQFDIIDPAIRDRLELHVHVPFPLTKEQIGEIVDSVAASYCYQLNGAIREQLCHRFFEPMNRNVATDPNDFNLEDNRKRISSNLFAPRQILSAMKKLEAPEKDQNYNPEGKYTPDDEDVKRMEQFYD